jgi:hypothetical protein
LRGVKGALALLGVAIAGLAGWRAWCVLSGPDVDTDAYAHHMIARAILADPRDLAIHWVWLPLFHYVQVPLVVLGGTMDTVRWINVLLSAALPVVLFRYARRTSAADAVVPPDAVALVAALLAAACPIAMQMGTTAQPEPLFALVVLAVAIAFEERRYVATALLLGAAVMLRYEAWASLAVVGAMLVLEPEVRRRLGLASEPDPPRKWLALAVPVALILVWAVLRRPVDGRWFGFLHDTTAFANDALHEKSALDRGIGVLARDLFYYPVQIAAKVLGIAIVLVPFGVVRTARQQGFRFVLVPAACLGFVSLTWITRSSLGLDRHFVCVVPLYATFAAQGVATLASLGSRTVAATRARQVLAASLAGIALVWLGVELDYWMGNWRGSIARGWPDRQAVGAYLRRVPGTPTVFCDEATVEILSGLDRRRFDRHWMDDPHTWELIAEEARARGPVFVATWRRKLKGHEAEGEIVLHAVGPGVEAADDVGLAVMRVQGAGVAAR